MDGSLSGLPYVKRALEGWQKVGYNNKGFQKNDSGLLRNGRLAQCSYRTGALQQR